ncbi:MAG: trigger factor family protein, partial [Candidatus Aureabacteria bacterium]|nr:trigger factor family protein [Candidatus Auribacterota bacterium]
MEVKTEEKKGCLLNLNVSIPHEEIASSEDEVLKHFQAQTTVPGFRKGKAPRN